ncbi:MAG: hypothetical protein ACM3PY_14420 [Omnitrophica WOR_2 bacterium]
MNQNLVLIKVTCFLMTLTACNSVSPAASPVLPDSIQEPLLLEAWTRLNNHQESARLWDGSSLTGHDLAQFVLVNAIPIVWDTEKICGNSSCSIRYCKPETGTCSFEEPGKPGICPIYMYPSSQQDITGLIGTLAHEIYHRTDPFGPVQDTRFEEYCAFTVEAQISKATWPRFGMYDPLIPEHLTLWIKDNSNGMEAYLNYPEYPASVKPFVKKANRGIDAGGYLPTEALGTYTNGSNP